MVRSRWGKLALILIILLLYCSSRAWAHEERTDGYFSFIDPEGNVFFQTARNVVIGDEFIDHENRHYRVTKLKVDEAFCEYLGQATPAESPDTAAGESDYKSTRTLKTAEAASPPIIGIYHTHSDESYVPTDGTASIFGRGGIFKVGNAFSAALKKVGLKPIHDTTSHDPHDAASYTRSRRTAAALLKHNPAALFDLHRDAVPRELYVASVKGQDVARLTLVVGRENPKLKANLNFAKQLKELNDQKNPGLIKGIFLAQGTYNQDLFDRAILIEAGTHENSRPAAERGISLFASVLPAIIPTRGQPAKTQSARITQRTGSWSTVGWIVGLLVIVGSAYLYLSTGSWLEVQSKVKGFVTREFTEFQNRNKGSDDKN